MIFTCKISSEWRERSMGKISWKRIDNSKNQNTFVGSTKVSSTDSSLILSVSLDGHPSFIPVLYLISMSQVDSSYTWNLATKMYLMIGWNMYLSSLFLSQNDEMKILKPKNI